MREICTSGSEGGGAGTTGAPYPYHDWRWCVRQSWMPAGACHRALDPVAGMTGERVRVQQIDSSIVRRRL